ncbi:MAG TPA: FKBP-type peptidyl-prolyl cis-trans isomerase N-terminal domain-containing protein, partial [Pirellulales bacterium]|nr:FKBP-type peptidyl-prolyl cis-trans isomerase N-terminal domain-containing protein [Pirellulales bacterium]
MLAATATFAAQAGKKPTGAQPAARRPAADAADEDTADADTDTDDEAAKKSDEDDADDANAGKSKPKSASGKPGKKPLGLKLAGDDEAELAELEEKFSYMQGYGMGKELAMRLQQMQQMDVKFNRKAFDKALTDALESKTPEMTEEEMQVVIESIQKRMQQAHAAAATENKKAEEK